MSEREGSKTPTQESEDAKRASAKQPEKKKPETKRAVTPTQEAWATWSKLFTYWRSICLPNQGFEEGAASIAARKPLFDALMEELDQKQRAKLEQTLRKYPGVDLFINHKDKEELVKVLASIAKEWKINQGILAKDVYGISLEELQGRFEWAGKAQEAKARKEEEARKKKEEKDKKRDEKDKKRKGGPKKERGESSKTSGAQGAA